MVSLVFQQFLQKIELKNLSWFQKAAKPFKGMEINVLSETIPTHEYESKLLQKHLRK